MAHTDCEMHRNAKPFGGSQRREGGRYNSKPLYGGIETLSSLGLID